MVFHHSPGFFSRGLVGIKSDSDLTHSLKHKWEASPTGKIFLKMLCLFLAVAMKSEFILRRYYNSL